MSSDLQTDLLNDAKVYGESFSKLPQDLYIPPDALEVYLDSFQGPLDLLLYLIRKNNIDILDIPMAILTTQYIEYVEKMKQIKLELAADYLLMSAMLIEIKSRMLLPPITNDEEDDLDPRAELVKKLIEYELMKTASQELDDISQVGRDRFIAQGYFEKVVEPKSLPDVSIEELFNAWKNVIKRAEQFETHKINRSELSVREHMSFIIKKLDNDQLISFDSFFNEEKDPIPKLVVCFLAILELTKENLIKINQQEPCSSIYIQRAQI
jgi:segregation and condensation protein A